MFLQSLTEYTPYKDGKNMTKRRNQHTNRPHPNTVQQQARADMWDMLNAFITTPDIYALQFTNKAGDLTIQRTECYTPRKRMGFDTHAVSIQTDEPEDYEDDEDDESEVRPAEEFADYIREIFKR